MNSLTLRICKHPYGLCFPPITVINTTWTSTPNSKIHDQIILINVHKRGRLSTVSVFLNGNILEDVRVN